MHRISSPANKPADRSARWSAGTTLGPWRLVHQLGEGAWTQVYRAAPIDSTPDSSADYVIKMIKPGAETIAAAMLQREAFVSKHVSHPHLACVLSAHIERPPLFLVMPFQAGSTVADELKGCDRLPCSKALWIARQICEGLSSLHSANWIHGDIKPDNIFVAHNGHVTVCDFGFARQLTEKRNRRIVLGTPAYLAPESYNDSFPDSPASDVYALGVMLYEMLTGSKPFAHTDEAELAAAHRLLTPPDPRLQVPLLPRGVCRLLRTMMAKEPLRRPACAELVELLVDLEIDAFELRD